MNEQAYAEWAAKNADVLDVAPDRGAFDYRERAFFVDETQQRITAATQALALNPADSAARQALNAALFLLPSLKKNMESHPDHAAVENKRFIKQAITEGPRAGIQNQQNDAAALRSTLAQAEQQAKQAGNTSAADMIAILLRGQE